MIKELLMHGNKRAKMRVSTSDIADAAGVSYRTALKHEKRGMWVYGNLLSIARYVMGKIGGGNDN
tara:strand:+ start:230 stop:424 length:195 start_codon:yes stop_codon:yes gene_type:complete